MLLHACQPLHTHHCRQRGAGRAWQSGSGSWGGSEGASFWEVRHGQQIEGAWEIKGSEGVVILPQEFESAPAVLIGARTCCVLHC